MHRTLRLAQACALALLAGAGHAAACGVCIEDKIAVTYDHAVVTRATQQGHVVVFAAMDGMADAQAMALDATTAARRARGVDRGSVRAAAQPAALSFALDPGVQPPERAIAAIEKSARTPGLKLTLLKVVR
jgi:hypothetical protein